MPGRLRISVFCVAILFSAIVSAQCAEMKFGANQLSKNTIYRYKDGQSRAYPGAPEKKSPGVAFLLGFVPGFFAHGMGHNYVNDRRAAKALMLVELCSITSMYIGGRMNSDAILSEDPTIKESKFGNALFVTGAIFFLGSWVYDFAAAPGKAIRYNNTHGFTVRLYPAIGKDSASLNIAFDF